MLKQLIAGSLVCAAALGLAAPAHAAGIVAKADVEPVGTLDPDVRGVVRVRAEKDGEYRVKVILNRLDAGKHAAYLFAGTDPDGDGVPNGGSIQLLCERDAKGKREVVCTAKNVTFDASLELWDVHVRKLDGGFNPIVARAVLHD